VNWNQFGQVPVPRGVRSPKGHDASSITRVCGVVDEVAVDDVVETVVELVVVTLVVVVETDDVGVVVELDDPDVAA